VVRRIGIVNEKGGSCKTTLAVHLGAYLASQKRKRVLLVDLDPQGQLGKTLGYDVNSYSRTALELLLDEERNPELFVRRTRFEKLDVILSNKSIALFPTLSANDPERHLRLHRVLNRVSGYDFIVMDSPANFGTTMLNIFSAADEIVVPVNASFLALDGCAELVRTLSTLRTSPGVPPPELRLIVPTLYRPTRMADSVIDKLLEHFPGQVYREPLRYDVKMEEAQSHGLTIWEYAPRARSADMLAGLGDYLLALGPAREKGMPEEKTPLREAEPPPLAVDLRGQSREA
jgi:chromosome partitioning protein